MIELAWLYSPLKIFQSTSSLHSKRIFMKPSRKLGCPKLVIIVGICHVYSFKASPDVFTFGEWPIG